MDGENNSETKEETKEEAKESKCLDLYFMESNFGESLEHLLEAIRGFDAYVQAIGPEQTREKLLQEFEDSLRLFEDYDLEMLVERLSNALPVIGGPKYAHHLLHLLIEISKCDNEKSRSNAVDAIYKLLDEIDESEVDSFFEKFTESFDEDAYFSQICSSIDVISVCYLKANESLKPKMRDFFLKISASNSSILRKYTASALIKFISILELEHVLKQFLPVLKSISEDNQDSVRISAVQIATEIARRSKNEDVKDDLLKIIKLASVNSSWRVRQRVGLYIHDILEAFLSDSFYPDVLKIYEDLIEDKEKEVRIYAAENIFNFVEKLAAYMTDRDTNNNFDEFFITKILPLIFLIMNDEAEEVKLTLSTNLTKFSLVISNECFVYHIFPIFDHTLESGSIPQKENLLLNIINLPETIDISNSLSTINKAIFSILNDHTAPWRSRRSLLVAMIALSKFTTRDYFTKHLLTFYIILLNDTIYATRRTASIVLPLLIKKYGMTWFLETAWPRIKETVLHHSYLVRYSAFFCIQEILQPTITVLQPNGHKKHDCFKKFENMTHHSEEKRKYLRKFCIINRLNEELKLKLQDFPCSYLTQSFDDNYNIQAEDTTLYTEDLLDILDQKVDAVIQPIESDSDKICYSEGVLILLNVELPKMLLTIEKDPSPNVKDRAVYLLVLIKKCCDTVEGKFAAEWIRNELTNVSEDEKLFVEDYVKNKISLEEKTNSISNGIVEEKLVDDEIIDTAMQET